MANRTSRRRRRACRTVIPICRASGTPPRPRQCVNGAGDSVPCGNEIGGSPLGGNLGRNLPGGALPYQPWAASSCRSAMRF